MKFFLVLIDSCCSTVICMTINYKFFLDSVRYLMQEQYIDELVFKCLTLECDHLITQPGQFAGTCIYHGEFG